MLQQRSISKKSDPGKWCASASGHISAGEESYNAAIKEFQEELGIKIEKKDLLLIDTFKSPSVTFNKGNRIINNHFVDLYIVNKEIDIKDINIQPEEVNQVNYFSIDEFIDMVKKCDNRLTNTPILFEHLVEYLKENIMQNEGTFQYCTNCSSNPVCCSNFNKINAPVLNREELEKIKPSVGNEKFYNTVEDNLYSIKLQEDNCIFYKNNKCTIYDNRPTDCKLYPFDIIKSEQKYYLILYLLDCIDSKNFEDECARIDSIVEDIIPWINEFTDERNFTKMKDKKYKIIKEIKL